MWFHEQLFIYGGLAKKSSPAGHNQSFFFRGYTRWLNNLSYRTLCVCIIRQRTKKGHIRKNSVVIHSQVHLTIYNKMHNLSMKSETCRGKSLSPLYLDVLQLVLGIIGVPEAPVRQDSNVVSFAFLLKIGGSLGDDRKKMFLWSYGFKKDGLLNCSRWDWLLGCWEGSLWLFWTSITKYKMPLLSLSHLNIHVSAVKQDRYSLPIKCLCKSHKSGFGWGYRGNCAKKVRIRHRVGKVSTLSWSWNLNETELQKLSYEYLSYLDLLFSRIPWIKGGKFPLYVKYLLKWVVYTCCIDM